MANMLGELNEKINGSAKNLEKGAKETLSGAKKALEKYSEEVNEKTGEVAENISDAMADYYKTGRTYVKQNPVKGVFIAALFGAFIGTLMSVVFRRSSH